MNEQELFETMKAYSYDLFDVIEHDPEDYKDATLFDIIATVLYATYESAVGSDILLKRVLEMTPDEFANNMANAISMNGKAIGKIFELHEK